MRIVIDLQSCQSESRFRGIGRYSMSLTKSIAHRAGNHEIWVALNDRFPDTIPNIRLKLEGFVPKERIVTFSVPSPILERNPHNIWRTRTAELIREYFLAGLKPDIVHVPNLFEGWEEDLVSSIGALGHLTPIAATVYDLIPYNQQKKYLPTQRHKDYYRRKIQSLKNADLLLAMSDYSKQEAITALGFRDESIVNISAAADTRFKPHEILQEERRVLFDRYKITRPFIMYAPSGYDERKNITGLITAFSNLPYDVRSDYQLVISARIPDEPYAKIIRHAKAAGLRDDELVITNYVGNDDLIALYNLCRLFVFPPLLEDFGLPALEAMACGAPVIGSNTTSIPEIIGRSDAMFDPTHPQEITRLMLVVLKDEGFRKNLRDHGREQAKKFSWDQSAQKAIIVFEELHKQNLERTQVSGIFPPKKPRLAFVSPLPPEKSGVADYSAELIPELARFYDITVIIDQSNINAPFLEENFPARNVAWFEANADNFDRILYQIGNSPFHKHMFTLLNRHPGVIVLHDFFLGHVMHWIEATSDSLAFFRQSLYYSHGYSALSVLDLEGPETAKWNYPCNKSMLDQAEGIIVHSQHALDTARKWYGNNATSKFFQIPHLRSLPQKTNRGQARAEFGFRSEDFLVCAFGFITPAKLSDRLLDAWLGSSLVQDKRCHLVFVGENEGSAYGKALVDRISNSRFRDNIHITGFVSSEYYKHYLEAADVAVQLRYLSRGETSGSVLDALAHGLALIINAHGTMAEYPDDIVMKLPDDFTDTMLIRALESLRIDSGLREQIGEAGRRYIAAFHDPGKISEEYYKAIENFAKLSQNILYRTLLSSLGSVSRHNRPSETDLLIAAEAIASNTPQVRQRQLLVDVSILAKQDLKTGIERVVRGVLLQLLNNPPEGFRVEPVYYDGGIFRYARHFTTEMLGIGTTGFQDDKIEVQREDIFLGLDWNPYGVFSNIELFAHFKSLGLEVFFIVYDLLPVLHPEFFPPESRIGYEKWIRTIAEVANGLVCISRSVSDEIREWLAANPPNREEPLAIGYFYLGADIENSVPTIGLSEESNDIMKALESAPSFLMVGTVEPRKGHKQILSAFDQLWSENMAINLLIVGKEGWQGLDPYLRKYIIEISNKIRNHSQYGKRLFWLEGISDEYLERIYSASTCLLAASEAEGFGLSLIEAAQKKLPILARDIPVFREVAGEHASYFKGMPPENLVQAIKSWLELSKQGKVPSSEDMPWLTWKESTNMLMGNILDSKVVFEVGKQTLRETTTLIMDRVLIQVNLLSERSLHIGQGLT